VSCGETPASCEARSLAASAMAGPAFAIEAVDGGGEDVGGSFDAVMLVPGESGEVVFRDEGKEGFE